MEYDKIGKFISECRKQKGYTQKELGKKLGLTDKAISKWERGLGCPDISVLEQLSNILNITILEILKGEKLQEEKINPNDATKLINETVNYTTKATKEKYQKIISKSIIYLIIFIGLFLIILNISHIIYLNEKTTYNFNNQNMQEIQEQVNQLEKKVKTIKQNQGKYKDDDYKKIINLLDKSINKYQNLEILKYQSIQKIGYEELYKLDINIPSSLEIIKIYEILVNYNPTLNIDIENYKQLFFIRGYSLASTSVTSIYKYQIYNINDENSKLDNNHTITSRIINYKYLVSSYNKLLKSIIETGDIHE